MISIFLAIFVMRRQVSELNFQLPLSARNTVATAMIDRVMNFNTHRHLLYLDYSNCGYYTILSNACQYGFLMMFTYVSILRLDAVFQTRTEAL